MDELNYVTFILGRDEFLKDLPFENDLAFEKCKSIAKDFIKSKFNNQNKGIYECLQKYIEFYSKNMI